MRKLHKSRGEGFEGMSKSIERNKEIPDKYRAVHMETALPMSSKGNCSDHTSRFKIPELCNHGTAGGGGGLFGWPF